MAAAASGALPGDPLYPIKRGAEQAGTAVRFGDASKGEALLGQAAARLDEVRALQAQGSPDAELISTTVDAFRTAAEAGSARLFAAYQDGGDTANITTVRDFTAEQMGTVADLSGTSASTDEALLDAADTLADIDQQARALCGGVRTGAVTRAAGSAVRRGRRGHGRQPARAPGLTGTASTSTRPRRPGSPALKGAAEKSAGELPPPSTAPPAARASRPAPPRAGDPVTSTLTPDGTLVPSTGGGTAVKDLVSGRDRQRRRSLRSRSPTHRSALWWTTSPAPSTT